MDWEGKGSIGMEELLDLVLTDDNRPYSSSQYGIGAATQYGAPYAKQDSAPAFKVRLFKNDFDHFVTCLKFNNCGSVLASIVPNCYFGWLLIS